MKNSHATLLCLKQLLTLCRISYTLPYFCLKDNSQFYDKIYR